MVVPVLVDASRSMRIADQAGAARIASAVALATDELTPALQRFSVERWSFGSRLVEMGDALAADDRASDLAGALRAIQERYRDRPVAGIIVISDGGETGADAAMATSPVPIYTVGVGSPALAEDLEVLDVSAGDTTVSESAIDLTVSVVGRGRPGPFDVKLLENGHTIDTRRVVSPADGGPNRVTFTVEPAGNGAALYTVEIPAVPGELVVENNRRSLLVEPPSRRRRLLIVEGAPAFEHSFIKRALASDAGLEVDATVRKGRDAEGAATYFLQGEADRVTSLATGFPAGAAALGEYDAIVLANIEADTLTRQQLEMVSAFVGRRGGGLLVLGIRSFDRQTLVGSPIENLLPLGLTDRSAGLLRGVATPNAPLRAAITSDGMRHPAVRIGEEDSETARRWLSFPPLAGAAALGPPRPGAQVLAAVAAPDGLRPLVASQRYGQGRVLLFTGEASWRWRMQLPSSDRSFELFWRQAARWLASGARGRMTLEPPATPAPGDSTVVSVEVRDETFEPVLDGAVTLRVTPPGGVPQTLTAALADPETGRYSAQVTFATAGVYRLQAVAERNGKKLGEVAGWSLAGGVDREMSDPRLNEEVLRRLSRASGGQYVRAADVSRILPLLRDRLPRSTPPRVEDVWNRGWVFALAVALLSLEWGLRRARGLR